MFKLVSTAFKDGSEIPRQFTGEGDDISPPLKWIEVPAESQELVLICEDPDAPGAEPWVHWVVYGISPFATNGLPENIPPEPHIERPLTAKQAINSFGKIGYGGPFPPPGHGTHHYYFRLFALNTKFNIEPGADPKKIFQAMQGHVLQEAQLIGTYRREKMVKKAS